MHLPFILAELENLGSDEALRVRSRQQALVFREICMMANPSRRALVKRLGLRSSTVSAILDELIDSSLVSEVGPQSGNDRGRPRLLLAPQMNSRVAISLYIEHLKLCGGVVNLAEEVLAEQEVAIPKQADGETFLAAFEQLVRTLLDAVPPGAKVLGLAFSPVGAVENAARHWVMCNRWPAIQNVDFTPLEQSLGLPVIVRRNLETILDYEIQTTAELQHAKVVLFHWGYGVGAAYSHFGTVLETERGNFSGIGHTVINPASTKRCQCGALGCLEAEAAIWALLRRFHEIDPGVTEENEAHYEVLSRALFRDIAFMQEAVEAVQVGLRNLCKMLSPDYLLFLSPFAANRTLISTLQRCVQSTFPHELHYEPEFRVVGGSFRGCLFANVYPLFRRELRACFGGDAGGAQTETETGAGTNGA